MAVTSFYYPAVGFPYEKLYADGKKTEKVDEIYANGMISKGTVEFANNRNYKVLREGERSAVQIYREHLAAFVETMFYSLVLWRDDQ